MSEERSVLIVGAGTMGHGIAVCFVDAGWRVILVDPDDAALARARLSIASALDLFSRIDGSPDSRREGALKLLSTTVDMPDCVPDFAIETVPEELELKRRVLREIESRAASDAVICSNTSALAISSLAEGMKHPERFLGTHFWNPPYILPCVEVVPGRHTALVAVERTVDVLRLVGRRPVALKHDLPGFVGNRLQHAMQREAMAIVESGAISPEDLDDIVRNSFGLRAALLGPFERADLGGIDVTTRVQEYLLPLLEDAKIPSGLLTDRVERGDLGAKTGRGFFDWDEEEVRRRVESRDEALLRIVRLLRTAEENDGNR